MPPPPALEVVGVSKRFRGRSVLDGVDVGVQLGQVHGLLGPNGAGKTTLLRIVLGLVRPDDGVIRLQGVDQVWPGVLVGVAGFVEGPRFYPYLSGRKNLRLLARLNGGISDAAVADVLDRCGLTSRAEDLVGDYSLGMRQRLGVAAALLGDPQLLVLDEPSSGLDPRGARDLRALLKDLAGQGKAVVLSSHVLAEVEDVCDEVTVLRAGRLAFSGAPHRMRPSAPLLTVHTNNDAVALRLAPVAVHARARPEGGLLVHGQDEDLDRYVLQLAVQGIAVRRAYEEGDALESAYIALTADAPPPRDAPGDEGLAELAVRSGQGRVHGLPTAAAGRGRGGATGSGQTAPDPAGRTRPASSPPSLAPTAPGPDRTGGGGARRPAGRALDVFRVEWSKLAAQGRVRGALLLCVLGPVVFALALTAQSGAPSDSLFGRYAHESGFAFDLVVLGFAGQWVLPLLVAVVAADVFASEDACGTWSSILTRSVSRRHVVAGKAAAAATWGLVVVVVLSLSTVGAGMLTVGRQPLVSLSGTVLPAARATELVACAWMSSLLPVLGWTGVALALSALLHRTGAAILATGVLGAAVQLLTLVPLPRLVQRGLLSAPAAAWHGLFVEPQFHGPLVRAGAVAVIYAVAGVAVSTVVVGAREFRAG